MYMFIYESVVIREVQVVWYEVWELICISIHNSSDMFCLSG